MLSGSLESGRSRPGFSSVMGSEVPSSEMAIRLGLITLSVLIHRQRTTPIAGVPVTPRAMTLAILGITAWNLLLPGLLIGVEILPPSRRSPLHSGAVLAGSFPTTPIWPSASRAGLSRKRPGT